MTCYNSHCHEIPVGDKEGLYRAILKGPIAAIAGQFGAFGDPALTFAAAPRYVLQPFVAMAPEVLASEDAARRIVDRLVGYSVALPAHEIARRQAIAPAQPKDRRATRAKRPSPRKKSP